MTQEEFLRIAKAIKAIYIDSKIFDDEESFAVWYETVKDVTYQEAYQAFFVHANSSPYPPKPSDLRRFAYGETNPELNEHEAWSLVSKAIRNGNYGAEEEFNKLPPIVQKAVGSPNNISNWALLPCNDVQTVIASNFMRQYRAELERAKLESLADDALKLTENTMGRIEG